MIVTRAKWKALEPRGANLMGTVAGVGVHWEGAPTGVDPHDRCDDLVRAIQRFHMNGRGWNDIAYNFLVCEHGTIFEGRGWGVRSAANGTDAANKSYHAVCFMGGTGDPFTTAAKAAIVALVAKARRLYPKGLAVKPHSFFKATECPGDVIRSWLASDPFMVTPPPEDDMPKPADYTSACLDYGTGGYFMQTFEGGVDGHNGARVVKSYKDYLAKLGARQFLTLIPNGHGGIVQIATDGTRWDSKDWT